MQATPLIRMLQLLLLTLMATTATVTAAAAAAAPGDSRCLQQKMLISCAAASASSSPSAAIVCGLASHGRQLVPMATEVLLDWQHDAASGGSSLSLELSKPASGLALVQLDLSGTGLCTGNKSGALLDVSFPAQPGPPAGPRLALAGLQLPAAGKLSLAGSIVVNAGLLAGLPALERLAISRNNLSAASPLEPLAAYAITGAPALTTLSILASIHSVDYATPLLSSLARLHTAHILRSNLLVLKAGTFQDLPALRYLYLTENNIQDLEPGSLARLASLEHLSLDGNGLKRLGNYAFQDLGSLRRLSLAGNRIGQVLPNAFYGLARLQHLDLSDNQLSRLPEAAFVQLHSLQTLKLGRNRELLGHGAGAMNDTFCPLESLRTLWLDAPLDCQLLGSPQVVQFVVTQVRPKKYSCDLSELQPELRPCHRWLERLALRRQGQRGPGELPTAAATAVGSSGGSSQAQPLSVILLVIFGIVCLVHVATTAVTIYVCRKMRRRGGGARGGGGNGGGSATAKRGSPSVSSPEEERSLDASPAASKEGVLVSFHTTGNGGSKRTPGDKDGARGKLNARDKSYDFNEDENRG